MDYKKLINKGISIRKQKPGLPDDGPITQFLRSMERSAPDSSFPISLVGADVARLFAGRSTRVVYMHTEGSGITPWRRLIVLDADYREVEQINSPAQIGLVAHELTHLLQRELEPGYYWPSGGLHPSFSRRWIGDSTNYMEVLSYLVGWTVEYDFIAALVESGDLSPPEHSKNERRLKSILNHLATLTGKDARNACRLVVKIYSTNPIYRKNYRLENRLADRRIPPGSWHYWLRQLGFSLPAIDHIMLLAARGQEKWIDPSEIM